MLGYRSHSSAMADFADSRSRAHVCLHIHLSRVTSNSYPHIYRGHSAISGDDVILISNLFDGMAMYTPSQPVPLQTFQHPMDATRNFPLAVAFLQSDQAVVSGAQQGDVIIWDRVTGKHMQTLVHDGK